MDQMFIFIAYTVGTLFGLYVGSKVARAKVIESTIDNLINQKFIKTKTINGEVEILRYDEQ